MTVTVAPPSTRWAAHLWVPSGRRGSHVDDVAEVSALMRAPLEDWQLEAVDALTAYGRGGIPLMLEGCLIVCRQNGKTFGVGRPIAVTECLYGVPSLSTWTAHLKDTAKDTFGEIKALMGRKPDGVPFDEDAYVPELGQYVVSVSDTDSEEGITFASGSELAFRARSSRAGRGKRPRRLYADEALYMTGEEAAAIVPGMGRQGPTAGILYMSSPALSSSEYLHDLVRRGREGGDESLAFVEHCAPGSFEEPGCKTKGCDHMPGNPGCSLDRDDYWRAANPAYRTGSMTRTYLSGSRSALKARFAREHLGWHDPLSNASLSPITVALWSKNEDVTSTFEGRPVFGVAVTKDSSRAAIAAAGWRSDGLMHVETVAVDDGDDWLVDRAAELKREHRPRGVAVDKGTAAAAHLETLVRISRLRVTEMGTADCGRACAGLLSKLKAGNRLRHRGENDPHLQDAALGARRRDIGPGLWAWAPKTSEVDTVTLEAATNALWLLEDQPRPRPLVARR